MVKESSYGWVVIICLAVCLTETLWSAEKSLMGTSCIGLISSGAWFLYFAVHLHPMKQKRFCCMGLNLQHNIN